MASKSRFAVVFSTFCALATTRCKGDSRYESVVQIVSKTVVETSLDGKAKLIDLELEWDACPGEQFQVIRGGDEFAACAEGYREGDYLPVVVKHFWDAHGYYRWDIEKLGDCARSIGELSDGSYEKSQECHATSSYGYEVGFFCSRKHFQKLVAICPWMKR